MSCPALHVMSHLACHIPLCMSCPTLHVMSRLACHVPPCMSCPTLHVMSRLACHVPLCMSYPAFPVALPHSPNPISSCSHSRSPEQCKWNTSATPFGFNPDSRAPRAGCETRAVMSHLTCHVPHLQAARRERELEEMNEARHRRSVEVGLG